MMIKMTDDQMTRKLRMEKIEVCLNCRKLSECEDIGKYEECQSFDEVEGEVWTIKKV